MSGGVILTLLSRDELFWNANRQGSEFNKDIGHEPKNNYVLC